MLKRALLLFIIPVILAGTINAQDANTEGSLVKWMTLKEAMEKVKTQPRPIIIDFYTDWCGWCKHMMKTTYADQGLAQYINTNFYPVRFNAEGKDTVEYLGQKYMPTSDAPRTTHPLAAKLLQGKLMYPTTLFLNGYDKEKNEFRFSTMAAGYLDVKKIEPILIFMLENVYHNSTYDDFNAAFEKAFYDSTTTDELKKLKWLMPQQAFTATTPSKKKKMVLIHTEWCNSCRVMQRTTFIDTLVNKYLTEKFDLVDFNPEITDTIMFKGQQFTNPRTPQVPFHQLALALTRNNFTLPSLIILDEDNKPVDAISFYVNAKFMYDIAHFYGDNIYKTKTWQQYQADKEKKEEPKGNQAQKP